MSTSSNSLLSDIKREIARPILAEMSLPGDLTARVNLMTGIAAVESGLRHKVQVGGPALGFWQMEPFTHDDCWTWLGYPQNAFLQSIGLSLLPAQYNGVGSGSARAMVACDAYAVFMAAIKFYRTPFSLPRATDAFGMCSVWKGGYNGPTGAGAVTSDRISLFQDAIDA